VRRISMVLLVVAKSAQAEIFHHPGTTTGPVKSPISIPNRLTLNQAETIALQQAPSLAAANYNTQAAQQVVQEARSQFFPQVLGEITAVGTGNGIENAFGGSHQAKKTTRLGATAGLSASTLLNHESNGINITQLIFDFGRTANLTAASKFDAMSEAEREKVAKEQVLWQTAGGYFHVLKAQALLSVANRTVAARQVVYDDVAALAMSMLKSDLDVLFARGDLQKAEQLVLEAKAGLSMANAELSRAMGLQEDRLFTLAEEPLKQLPAESVAPLVARALQNRPDLIALRDHVESARKFARAQGDARLPKLEAFGSFGRTPVGDPGVKGNYSAAGINLELPLFTGGLLSSRQDEAELRKESQQELLSDQQLEVVKQVNTAWFDAVTALKNIDLAKELVSDAQQALQLAEGEYRSGQTSIMELSQAHLNALQAEIGAASAKFDYQLKLVQLDYETGDIALKSYGVRPGRAEPSVLKRSQKH
jgi:outer membrane protein